MGSGGVLVVCEQGGGPYLGAGMASGCAGRYKNICIKLVICIISVEKCHWA